MPKRFISMLRGINVSGQKKIRMAELKRMYESLGLVNVATYVQSGNVIFDSPKQDAAQLGAAIKNQIEDTFGFTVPVFMRKATDFQRIISNNPFLTIRKEEPATLYVTFLAVLPSETALSNLTLPNNETGEYVVREREIFLFVPNGYGRTKLSNNFFERKLKIPATTRNWKTVNTLYQMASNL